MTPLLMTLEPEVVTGCTADLGPRWLLVTSIENDLTGYAFDDFGCKTVRMTSNPATQEPGVADQAGTVSGALGGVTDLLSIVAETYESVPNDAPTDPAQTE
ncbi:MAG: hypothetical protein Q7T71_09325 [Herbiconiux sp.]|nr:hypothetical protein [Herbiconiux sp.]